MRWTVDRVCSSSCGSQRSLGTKCINHTRNDEKATHLCFGEVGYASIDSTLEKVNLGEDHFVVELLELRQKGVDSRQSRFELLGFQLSTSVN